MATTAAIDSIRIQAGNPPKINSLLKEDPFATHKSSTRWSHTWTILALSFAATFITASVTAYIYTAAYATANVLLYIGIVTIGLYYSSQGFNFMWNKSNMYAKKADTANKIILQIKALKNKDVSQLVRDLDIKPGKMTDFQLKYLFAKYKHLESLSKKAYQKAIDAYPVKGFKTPVPLRIGKKIESIPIIDRLITGIEYSNPKQRATFDYQQNQSIKQHELFQRVSLIKLEAAYYLKLIECPDADDREDYATIIPLSYVERLIANARGHEEAFTLIKENGMAADDIIISTIRKLASEVFGVQFSDEDFEKVS